MSLRNIVAAIRRRRQEPPLPASAEAQADLLEVFKGERRMELKRQGQAIRCYRVALGFAPERHKEREGDGCTPEGSYTVDARNPQSAFQLFVGHPARDWTTGCVAVTDAEIREVWSLVPTGARVVIHP
jgi:L,D-peptidoglycan transpeptidase YkuD (ErfK/YbiS/YcfS/YnhG family)